MFVEAGPFAVSACAPTNERQRVRLIGRIGRIGCLPRGRWMGHPAAFRAFQTSRRAAGGHESWQRQSRPLSGGRTRWSDAPAGATGMRASSRPPRQRAVSIWCLDDSFEARLQVAGHSISQVRSLLCIEDRVGGCSGRFRSRPNPEAQGEGRAFHGTWTAYHSSTGNRNCGIFGAASNHAPGKLKMLHCVDICIPSPGRANTMNLALRGLKQISASADYRSDGLRGSSTLLPAGSSLLGV